MTFALKKCIFAYSLFITTLLLVFMTTSFQENFKRYLKLFNKSHYYYNKQQELYQRRINSFQNSLLKIEELNNGRTCKDSAFYGLTKFSDLSSEEFAKRYLNANPNQIKTFSQNNKPKSKKSKRYKRSLLKLPEKVDWRLKGVIGEIKNQQNCGACWSFATIETIESIKTISDGKFELLSAQQLIDCVLSNKGCKGGNVCAAVKWLKYFKTKIQREEDYPTVFKNEICLPKNYTSGVQLLEYSCQYLAGREDILLGLLANVGPVSVAVNAYNWQHYLGGVIQFHCNNSVLLSNHATQIVGYDLTASIPHYIVRNSWGTDFGNDGYVYIAIGQNLCGIANEVVSVKVK